MDEEDGWEGWEKDRKQPDSACFVSGTAGFTGGIGHRLRS